MSTTPTLDPAYLAQLAEETGDYRLLRAAEALRDLRRDDAREPEDWLGLVRLMASRFALDCQSTRAKHCPGSRAGSAHVGFRVDFVRFTPNTGRSRHPSHTGSYDPNQTFRAV